MRPHGELDEGHVGAGAAFSLRSERRARSAEDGALVGLWICPLLPPRDSFAMCVCVVETRTIAKLGGLIGSAPGYLGNWGNCGGFVGARAAACVT